MNIYPDQLCQLREVWTTSVVHNDAAFLYVDLEKRYLTLEHYLNEDRDDMEAEDFLHLEEEGLPLLSESILRVKQSLNSRKNKHKVYFTHETPLIDGFQDLFDHRFPYWGENLNCINGSYSGELVHPEIIRSLKDEKMILVCGMWEEMCVRFVVQGLRDKGVNAYLLRHPDYTVSYSLLKPGISLEQAALNTGFKIKNLDEVENMKIIF